MGEAKKGSKKRVKLREALEEKTREAEEYLTQLKYLKAEFENYKKRAARDKEEQARFAAERLIIKLLEVVDNMERAIEAGRREDGTKENLLQGVEMTYRQLMRILEQEGVERIKAVGETFDPYLHECVAVERKEDVEEDTVLQELQKGYTLNSKVIRHAKVKVAKR